jgi:anti-anti-sigma regulatory factor
MLKISHIPVTEARDGNVFKVEGHAVGQWVEELRRVCDEALAADGSPSHNLVLDLNGLSFLDAAGCALFRELAARNVRFTNCSAFIAEQLKKVANDCR